MAHHVAHRHAELRRAGGVFLHALDFAADPFVEGIPQVRPVGAHLVQLRRQRRQHPAGDGRTQRPAHQPAALLADAFLDGVAQRVLPAGHQRPELPEDEAEHLLMPAAFDQAVQGPRDDLAGAGTAEDARHQARHHPSGSAVLDRRQKLRQHAGQCHGQGSGRGGIGQEAVQDAGQVQLAQHRRDVLLGEHVVRDEAPECQAQTLLLPGDDGGVGDGDAEGMAEQGGDREPVGDPAHEPGLRRRAQQGSGVFAGPEIGGNTVGEDR